MRTITAIKIISMKAVALISTMLFAISCDGIWMDRNYPLDLKNNSSHSIGVFFNYGERYMAIYPDTTIWATQNGNGLAEVQSQEKKVIAESGARWESVFEVNVPSDTVSVFIFHSDTLSKYDWETIQKDYKILQRYDLSLEDLERLKFTLTYPPDASMAGIKMYPE